MRICVVGAAGYIGSLLCRQLLEYGYRVLALDNGFKGSMDGLIELAANKDFEFKECDVCDEDKCKRTITGVDGIINLAALVGFPICKRHTSLSYLTTVQGMKNVIKARESKNIPLVYSSTGSCYGACTEICTENSPTNAVSEYGKHKLEAEKIVEQEENSIIFRFATLMGVSPQMRVNLLVNELCYLAVTQRHINIFEPDNLRTFLNIEDACLALIRGLSWSHTAKYKVYNCGDDRLNFSKRQVAEKIKEKTDCHITYNDTHKDADLRNYISSHSRIFLEFGFEASKMMDDTIDDLMRAIPMMRVVRNYQ